MRDELKDEVLQLSLKDKESLYVELGKVIREEKIHGVRQYESMCQRVIDVVLQVMGLPAYNASSHVRKHVISRVIIANAIMQNGATESKVGRTIGKDHSTINHYKVMLEEWLTFPKYYPEEVAIWEQVNNLI